MLPVLPTTGISTSTPGIFNQDMELQAEGEGEAFLSRVSA